MIILFEKTKGALIFSLFTAILMLALNDLTYSQQSIFPGQKFNEENLKTDFEKFISQVDSLSLTKKYPEIAGRILSHQPRQQEIAVKMLGESQEIIAIPWLILLLNSEDEYVQTNAGGSLEKIISSIVLKRRDMNFPQYVVLKPIQAEDIDLRPLAWIVLKLLRGNNINHRAYAITMVRYLNLYEFGNEIIKHKDSVHPAVSNKVKWAIESFDHQKKYEANELDKKKVANNL